MTTMFVRRAIAGAAFLFATAPVALAQTGGFGAKGGFNLATQQVTPAVQGANRQWLAGFVAGGFYSRPLWSRIDVQVEGLYVVKGARLRISGLTERVEIDYFDVPVLVRGRFGRYYVEGGADVALRLRARARIDFATSTESVDIANEVERADYGASGGGGLEIGRYVIDVRFTQGLKDVDADKGDSSHTKNRALAITGGVRF